MKARVPVDSDNSFIGTEKQYLDLCVLCCCVYTTVSVVGLSESAEMNKIHVRVQDANPGTKCKCTYKMQL